MTDSTPPAPPRPHRPEPIATTIAEPLAARAQEVAKGWLLVLLERVPLDVVGSIPATALAAEGPAICAAVARALGSDAELARLAPDGDLAPLARRIGPLAAAADTAATVAAVDALRACVWIAALELHPERAGDGAVAALAERLAAVAALVTASAVSGALAQAEPEGAAVAPVAPAPVMPAAPMPPPGAELRSVDPADAAGGTLAPMDDGELWISTLERHVDRCQREGGGLALLRVELVDGDRIVASATPDERGVPYGRLAQAIRRAIRRQDLVAADHHGRAWVIAPAVGRAGAIALAERIGAGVEQGEWRGAPLAATIGFAVYGEDGRDAVTLIERAEEAMLSASAAGVPIGEALPPSESEDPNRRGPRLVR